MSYQRRGRRHGSKRKPHAAKRSDEGKHFLGGDGQRIAAAVDPYV